QWRLAVGRGARGGGWQGAATSAVAAVTGALAAAGGSPLLPAFEPLSDAVAGMSLHDRPPILPEESRRGLIGRPEGRPRLERVLKDVLNARDADHYSSRRSSTQTSHDDWERQGPTSSAARAAPAAAAFITPVTGAVRRQGRRRL